MGFETFIFKNILLKIVTVRLSDLISLVGIRNFYLQTVSPHFVIRRSECQWVNRVTTNFLANYAS